MNTWTIKNSLGQTVESRFACDMHNPDDALWKYLETRPEIDAGGVIYEWTATLNLTGRVVMWRDGKTLHLAECIKEEGTTVLVWVGHQDVKRLRRDAVEPTPETSEWRTGEWVSLKEMRKEADIVSAVLGLG